MENEDEIRVVRISPLENENDWRTVMNTLKEQKARYCFLAPNSALIKLENPVQVKNFTASLFNAGIRYELHLERDYEMLIEQEKNTDKF